MVLIGKLSEHLNIISKWNLPLFIRKWFNYFSINMQIFLIKDFYQIELTRIIAVIFFIRLFLFQNEYCNR